MAHGSERFGSFHHPRFYEVINRILPFRPVYRQAVDDVVAARLPAGSALLDVGTGPGHVPIGIAKRCPELRVEGLDLSPEMIAYATRRAGAGSQVRFTVGDVADLPYPDGSFDLVVTTMSQHHWADADAGMREIRRVLKPGGQVWVYDFRFSLGRASRAAGAAFAGHRLERPRAGLMIGRLFVRPT